MVRINNGFCSMCTSLESIEIPKEVTFIGWESFSNCHELKSVVLPASLNKLEGNNFNFDWSLKDVTYYAKTVPVLGDLCFHRETEYGLIDRLYVPAEAIEDYKNSDWAQYFNEILPIDISGVEAIIDMEKNRTYKVYNTNGIRIINSDNSAFK